MNFFNKIHESLQEGIPLKLVVAKNKEKIVVSVIPDSDDPDLVPATISGLPDEVDSAFFAALGGSISSGNIHVNQKMVKTTTKKKEENPEKEESGDMTALKEFMSSDHIKFKNKTPEKEVSKKTGILYDVKSEKATEKPPEREPEDPDDIKVKPVTSGLKAPRAMTDKQPDTAKGETPWEEDQKDQEDQKEDQEEDQKDQKEEKQQEDVKTESSEETTFDDDDDWS